MVRGIDGWHSLSLSLIFSGILQHIQPLSSSSLSLQIEAEEAFIQPVHTVVYLYTFLVKWREAVSFSRLLLSLPPSYARTHITSISTRMYICVSCLQITHLRSSSFVFGSILRSMNLSLCLFSC